MPRRRSLGVVFAIGALLFAMFVALGSWQVVRRAWKLDLIERVDRRVHAPASAIPSEAAWSKVNAADDEYRHVTLSGVFLDDKEALVQAVTDLGAGFWVMTPLRLPDGSVVMINRGFVPPERRELGAHGGARPSSASKVTGLLRITEPKGGFLRSNDPAGNRWFSRDTEAIGEARGLVRVAPFFVDEEAAGDTATSREAPVGGLTVVYFHNSHLVYALTWYALALMVAGGVWRVTREGGARGTQD